MADLQQYFKNKKIWITGGTSGIGKAIVKLLLDNHAMVLVSGRNITELAAIKAQYPDTCDTFAFDVTNENEYQQTIAAIKAKYHSIDIMILNAGTSEYSDIENYQVTTFTKLMQINYFSVVYGVVHGLPLLQAATNPQLLIMGSLAGLFSLPRAEAYCASKAAVHALAEGLGAALYPKILVTTVQPGFVHTPLTDLNDFPMPLRISASKAAKIIATGIAKRKTVIRFPKVLSMLIRIIQITPRSLYKVLASYSK